MLLTVASVQAQTATTISVDVASSTILVGDDVRVGVTLDAEINAIATLTVTDGASYNESFYVALEGGSGSGSGSYCVPNLPAGTYSITASFAGNDQYAASISDAQTLQVNKVSTTLSLILREETMYVGDLMGFKVLLGDLNYSKLNINAVTTVRLTNKEIFDEAIDKVYVMGLVNGKADGLSSSIEEEWNFSPKDYQTVLTDLPAGTYKLKATFAGDDKYTGCESNVVTLTVSKMATTLSVADITPITAGQEAMITVTATPTDEKAGAVNTVATVTVGNTDYDVAIVNGTGTCYVPNLTAGTYNVTAQIAEDDKFLLSTSDVKTLTVAEGSTIVENNSVATVTVTPAVNTIAKVTVDGGTYYVPVFNGIGTFVVPQQTAGIHTVQAQFIEEKKYAPSTSDEVQLVAVTGVTLPFATGQEWATWCDDWAWKKPAGVTAYTISAVSGNTVTITAVGGETIPSHTPLLLRKTTDAVTPTKVITGTASDNYNATTGIVNYSGEGWAFYGNASRSTIAATALDDIYVYGNADGKQSYILRSGDFILVDNKSAGIAAHRCWLNVNTNGTQAPRMLSIGEGETTSISEMEKMRNGENEAYYTLDGRKVDGVPTAKGIYIYGGRKVVIK